MVTEHEAWQANQGISPGKYSGASDRLWKVMGSYSGSCSYLGGFANYRKCRFVTCKISIAMDDVALTGRIDQLDCLNVLCERPR